MLVERLQSSMMRLLNGRYLAIKPLSAEERTLPQAHTGAHTTDTRVEASAEAHTGAYTGAHIGAHTAQSYMLYAHIPFCERLCPYCSFNRFPFEDERARAYFKALRTEMRMLVDLGYDFKSMYIGGGTPTILIDELCELIDEARQLFSIEEVSCETNPNHLLPAYLDKLAGRVQRLSVGVQSFNDDLLRQMSRFDKYGSGAEILSRLQALGAEGIFNSLNADMIFNFPSQTKDLLVHDLACILESGVSQVTFYPLMVSPSVKRSLAKTVGKVDYRREQEFYASICEALTDPKGATAPYNFSSADTPPYNFGSADTAPYNFGSADTAPYNFGSAWTFNTNSRAMIDEYIVDYEEYPAIGSGGFSYLDGSLYVNTFSIDEYIKRVEGGCMSIAGKVAFTLHDRMRYRFMMQLFGLRLDKRQWEQDFGCTVAKGLPAEYAFYKTVGAFATDTPEELTLSPKGRYLLVALMRQFFIGVNGVRDLARAALPADERLLFDC